MAVSVDEDRSRCCRAFEVSCSKQGEIAENGPATDVMGAHVTRKHHKFSGTLRGGSCKCRVFCVRLNFGWVLGASSRCGSTPTACLPKKAQQNTHLETFQAPTCKRIVACSDVLLWLLSSMPESLAISKPTS